MRPRWDIDERGHGVGDARRLLGRIAEPGMFVAKRESDDRLELDVVTGVVSDEGRYATHGHTVRLRVTA